MSGIASDSCLTSKRSVPNPLHGNALTYVDVYVHVCFKVIAELSEKHNNAV